MSVDSVAQKWVVGVKVRVRYRILQCANYDYDVTLLKWDLKHESFTTPLVGHAYIKFLE